MSRTEQMNEFDERAVELAEADLERLLSIEPSPEFAAKIRARIAAEPPVRSWNWRRLLVPVAAAAAVVVVLALSSRNWSVPSPEQPSTTSQQSDIVLKVEKPNETAAIVPVAPAPDIRPTVRRASASPQREPEIIIDPAITDAIRRLAVAARNTTLDGSKGQSIAAPDSASETLPIAEELNVPELVLKPADQTGGQ